MASKTTNVWPFFTWSPSLTSTCAASVGLLPIQQALPKRTKALADAALVLCSKSSITPAKIQQCGLMSLCFAAKLEHVCDSSECFAHLPDARSKRGRHLRALHLCWRACCSVRLPHNTGVKKRRYISTMPATANLLQI